MPFGWSLYVGGNKENIAKLIVSPAAAAPSTVTKNVLLLSDALAVGCSVRNTCFHVVCAPLMVVEFDASIVPDEELSPRVRMPEKADALGKR